MSESAAHANLVQNIILYAEREFGSLAEYVVREDAVHPLRGERPPRVEGYVPDVYVTDVPTTMTLIGEAKTLHDIETEHSRRQIFAFLKYLSNTHNGIFVLSVPLFSGAMARRFLSDIKQPIQANSTAIVVLDRTVSIGF